MFVASDFDLTKIRDHREETWEPRNKQNILININKYIVKYDFDIADKLKCNPRNRTEQMEGDFKRAAIYEILHICSLELAQHKKTFNSMWTFNGA